MNEALVFVIGFVLFFIALFSGAVTDSYYERQATLECVSLVRDKPAMEINLLCKKGLAQ